MSQVELTGQLASCNQSLFQFAKALILDGTFIQIYHFKVLGCVVLLFDKISYRLRTSIPDMVTFERQVQKTCCLLPYLWLLCDWRGVPCWAKPWCLLFAIRREDRHRVVKIKLATRRRCVAHLRKFLRVSLHKYTGQAVEIKPYRLQLLRFW